jgi:hypothetical protein
VYIPQKLQSKNGGKIMKTLSEIKKSIITFYSNIQNKINDFSTTSVISAIAFAFSYALEDVYRKIEEVRRQAYISTATGKYLDRLIRGTFGLNRRPDTRSSGYIVIYGNNPITEPEKVTLKYAEYDTNLGEFTNNTLNASTKFIAYGNQGEAGTSFSLVAPKNKNFIDEVTKTINLQNRQVQYLILPVVSVEKGLKTNIVEGSLYTFPNPPQGLSGVLNTLSPSKVFFGQSADNINSESFNVFSTTQLIHLVNGQLNAFSVVNAFSFLKSGLIEIRKNTANDFMEALYTERPLNDPLGQGDTISRGLLLEYVDRTTSSITLKNRIETETYQIPFTKNDGTVIKLKLRQVSYDGTTLTANESLVGGYTTFLQNLERKFYHPTVSNPSGGDWVQGRPLFIEQKQLPVDDTLIFDPDNILDENYSLKTSEKNIEDENNIKVPYTVGALSTEG